jgi:hypothetical protein
MRIVIETTGSEGVAVQPSEGIVAGQFAQAQLGGKALDGGAPSDELLGALGAASRMQESTTSSQTEQSFATSYEGGKSKAHH